MAERDYGQYCGVARSLDVLGDRWAPLLVRDLLVGPLRFGELQAGLPRIPSNVLTSRLRDLESAGVVRRELGDSPRDGTRYALTDEGRSLEPVIIELGRWGARRLGDPRPGEVVTPASLTMALRTTFRPETGRATHTYEVHAGEVVVHAVAGDEHVEAAPGPAARPELTIDGPGLRALMAGERSASEALRSGDLQIVGPRRLLTAFARTFVIA